MVFTSSLFLNEMLLELSGTEILCYRLNCTLSWKFVVPLTAYLRNISMEGKHIIIFSFVVHSLFFELQTTCFELISYFELYLEIYFASMNNEFSALELSYELWVLQKTCCICREAYRVLVL